jgi:uncharacterized membrane protein YhiD involved in acid resistance
MVAAVGMAAATDLYLLAITTTLMTTGVLALLGPLGSWLSAKGESRRQEQDKNGESGASISNRNENHLYWYTLSHWQN